MTAPLCPVNICNNIVLYAHNYIHVHHGVVIVFLLTPEGSAPSAIRVLSIQTKPIKSHSFHELLTINLPVSYLYQEH